MAAGPVVRVLPDEPAIAKTFDYLVPESLGDQVRVGDRVRVATTQPPTRRGWRCARWPAGRGAGPPPT